MFGRAQNLDELRGGVLVRGRKHQIEIKYTDDESDPTRAATLSERLINEDGIRFMLGPYSSELTKAPVRGSFT